MDIKTAKKILSDKSKHSDIEIIAAQEVLIENLQNQLLDKDKFISRINLEAQRWFDNYMDLINKER